MRALASRVRCPTRAAGGNGYGQVLFQGTREEAKVLDVVLLVLLEEVIAGHPIDGPKRAACQPADEGDRIDADVIQLPLSLHKLMTLRRIILLTWRAEASSPRVALRKEHVGMNGKQLTE